MADFESPGTKVTQVRKGPTSFPAIATAVGGFLVFTAKGPKNTPIKVVGKDDAEEVFGWATTNPLKSHLPNAMKDFFDQGGASCYVCRFLEDDAAKAGATLSTSGGLTAGSLTSNSSSFPAQLADGLTFIGEVDGGGSATLTIQAARATKTGSGATYASVTASHKLVVQINGIPGNQNIIFSGSEGDQAAFLAKINAQLRGGSAVDASGEVKLQTDVLGSDAGGQIVVSGTDADVLTSLGLSTGAFATGTNNVGNVDEVTAAEFAGLMDATFAGSTTTVNANNSVTWSSDSLGLASSVELTGGTGVSSIAGFDTANHAGTDDSALPTVTITASSEGDWGNDVSYKAARVDTPVTKVAITASGSTSVLYVTSSARLSKGDTISVTQSGNTQRGVIRQINGTKLTLVSAITVPGGGYDGTEDVVLETWNLTLYDADGAILLPSPWRGLRMDPLAGAKYFENVINGAARTPITVADLDAATSDKRPATDSTAVSLTGGDLGSEPAAATVIAAIDSFDQAEDVNFISCPANGGDEYSEDDQVAIMKGLEAYGLRRQDVEMLHEMPEGTPPTGSGGAKDFIQNTANLASSYSAVYWPWLKRLDPETNRLDMFPPTPAVQGIIARTHQNRNFGKAPAGIVDGQVTGISGLEYEIRESSAEYDDMYPAGVNAILKFPGQGYAVFGSRTMDTTGEFGQLNVQIVFNINKRIIKSALRFVNFEPNDVSTRNSVVRILTAIFREQRLAGILQGESDNEAFFIQCDEKNNTPLVIASGKMKVKIGLAVERATEFLDVTMEIDTRAIDQQIASQNI